MDQDNVTVADAQAPETARQSAPRVYRGFIAGWAVTIILLLFGTTTLVNGEVVVPPGYVFAMGHNRDSSLDSRYWGFVPRANIIGKPLVFYWSYNAPTEGLAGASLGWAHLLDVAERFPIKTRWSRTFHFIRGYPLK